MEEKKKEEKKKGTSNKTAIIIACICGGLFFLFIICMFVLPFLLVTSKHKIVAPAIKNKTQEIIDKAEEEIEKYELEENDNEINCTSYSPKTISSRVFNDTYYKNNECTRYIISDLNIELVDKKIMNYEDDTYIHKLSIIINSKENNDLLEASGVHIELGKMGDYIIVKNNMGGSEAMEMFVYNKDGNLAYHIPVADTNHCQYVAIKSNEEVIVRQDYATDGSVMASNTCEASNLKKSFNSYCSNDNYLRIYYKLEEVNGKLELVEQNNYECNTYGNN